MLAHRLEETERRDEPADAPASRHFRHDPADFFALNGGNGENRPGQLEPVTPLAGENERRILSPSDQTGAADHDTRQGVGAPEAGEKEDRLAIPFVLVLHDAVPVVALALIDTEPLGRCRRSSAIENSA
jgi:hypothetical protein